MGRDRIGRNAIVGARYVVMFLTVWVSVGIPPQTSGQMTIQSLYYLHHKALTLGYRVKGVPVSKVYPVANKEVIPKFNHSKTGDR